MITETLAVGLVLAVLADPVLKGLREFRSSRERARKTTLAALPSVSAGPAAEEVTPAGPAAPTLERWLP